MDAQSERERDESENERWQRNFAELLQELRVAQTGVQILFAFLLTLAFSQPGFGSSTSTFEKTVYLISLLSAAAASAALIAPVAFHRMLFRQSRKPEIVRSAHRVTSVGLGLLFVAMVSAVLLATDRILSRPAAFAATAVIAVWFLLLWVVAPWRQRNAA